MTRLTAALLALAMTPLAACGQNDAPDQPTGIVVSSPPPGIGSRYNHTRRPGSTPTPLAAPPQAPQPQTDIACRVDYQVISTTSHRGSADCPAVPGHAARRLSATYNPATHQGRITGTGGVTGIFALRCLGGQVQVTVALGQDKSIDEQTTQMAYHAVSAIANNSPVCPVEGPAPTTIAANNPALTINALASRPFFG